MLSDPYRKRLWKPFSVMALPMAEPAQVPGLPTGLGHLQGNVETSEISRGLKELVWFAIPNSFKDRCWTASDELMQILVQRYSWHRKCKAKWSVIHRGGGVESALGCSFESSGYI